MINDVSMAKSKAVPKCPRMTISISELAEVLGVSRPTAYEIVRREDFDGLFYIGRKPLVSVAHLQKWIERQVQEAGL